MVFHETLVFGVQRPGWLYETPVVIGNILEHLIDGWLVAVCLYDGSLEIVRYKYLRQTSYVLEVL